MATEEVDDQKHSLEKRSGEGDVDSSFNKRGCSDVTEPSIKPCRHVVWTLCVQRPIDTAEF